MLNSDLLLTHNCGIEVLLLMWDISSEDNLQERNGSVTTCICYQDSTDANTSQWNPVNTDTKGTGEGVSIIRVSILSGLSK